MGSRQASIRALLAKIDAQVGKIEAEYKESLYSQAIDPELRVDLKNACENLRSVLDYLAADIRDRYCPRASSSDRFYFPRMCPESCRKASWRKAPADWLTTLPRYAA